MALEAYEVLDVVGDTFKEVSQAMNDSDTPGKVTKTEAAKIVSSAVMSLLKEYMDDEPGESED